MMQEADQGSSASPAIDRRPSYTRLLSAIAGDLPAIVAAVAGDVAGPDDAMADVEAEVRPAVERLFATLADGGEPSPDVLAALRSEGADAARAGVSVQRAIDRYLSAGWVVWAFASKRVAGRGARADRAAFADLGAALLRTGDVAAAAIAGGHGGASQEAAGRAATARAELLEELLEGPATPDGWARSARHATALGFDPAAEFAVVVAVPGDGMEPDADAAAASLLRPARPSRHAARSPGGLVGLRAERLVVVVPADAPEVSTAEAVASGVRGEWHAARSVAAGLGGVREAYLAASSAIAAVLRLGPAGLVVPAEDVLVERVLLADEGLLRDMVDRVLGPIERAPRGGPDLVRTLDAWLDAKLNAQATARILRVAPRTVAYRLARIERLIGRPLDGRESGRLSVALLGRRLLAH